MAKAPAKVRLARLLAIIPWIVERNGATIGTIAARFDLPEAEVLEDLSLVQCCEIPPYGPANTLGIVVIGDEVLVEPGAMLSRPLRLGPQEGFGLLTAGRAAMAAAGDVTGSLSSALEKLETALGERSPVQVELARPEMLGVIEKAVEARQRLDVDYYTAYRDELTSRRIDPYRVENYDGDWFVQAWCHRVDALRTFRVDRIEAAEPLDEFFEAAPEDLPPPRLGPGDDGEPVVIRLPPSAGWVVESYPTKSVEALRGGRGWAVTLDVAGDVFLERLMLRAGASAKIIKPASRSDVAKAAAARVLALYESH